MQNLKTRIKESHRTTGADAYTLRRKTTNEPFVPATEQEWAHLYMDGACAKKYYSCQGRQVYVPRKVAENPCRNARKIFAKENIELILNFEEKKYTINLNETKENIKNQIKNLIFGDYLNYFCNKFLDNLYLIEKNIDIVKKFIRKKKVIKENCGKNKKAPNEELFCVVNHLKNETTLNNFIENNFKEVQEFKKNNFTTILKNEELLLFLISGNEEIIYIEDIDAKVIKSNIVKIILNYANTKILENLSINYNGILKKYKRYIKVENPEKGKCQKNIINPEQELACVINRLKDEDSILVEKFIEENFETI